MTLYPRPLLTNGATHPAQQFRMLVRDLARGAEGITQGDDLKVTQRSTPGSGVTVSDGSAIVKGRVDAFQGHYAEANIGAANVDIAATGASPRTDMVILRIEDPEYEGTLNPVVDQVAYFQVITNVSSSATTIPDGRTGIPLARVTIPASTSTITNAMITDIRKIANPRTERTLLPQSPSAQSNLIGASTTYAYFSTAPGWTIAVPDWATTVRIKIDVMPMRFTVANYFGSVRATFGASLTLQPTLIDDNQGTGTRRVGTLVADTLTLPSAYRGTSQLLRVQGAGGDGNLGRIQVDSGTAMAADIEFIEAPR